jgi:hypothetical protein
MDSARALLSGVVDYAGLFPPAALVMAEAVAEYARAQGGHDAWMLGRFVLPAARLPEFAEARAAAPGGPDWRLSAIVRDGAEADQAAIAGFNADSIRHRARVDTIECKPQALTGIDWLADAFGEAVDVYVEVAAGDDAADWLARVAARGLKAKVRTGGLSPEAFPAPAALVDFIGAAVRLKVPLKATAGLHHAVRGSYRLTDEPGAARAPMYGYLNVLLATAALEAGLPASAAERILCQTDASTLRFLDGGVRWADIELPVSTLRVTRQHRLVSFGSCSFQEPVDELHELPDCCLLTPHS